MDKIKQAIEWAQKRLEIQNKALDKTQIEVLTFALHEIVSKNLDQPDVSKSVCEHCGFQPMIKVDDEYECEICGNTQKQTVC